MTTLAQVAATETITVEGKPRVIHRNDSDGRFGRGSRLGDTMHALADVDDDDEADAIAFDDERTISWATRYSNGDYQVDFENKHVDEPDPEDEEDDEDDEDDEEEEEEEQPTMTRLRLTPAEMETFARGLSAGILLHQLTGEGGTPLPVDDPNRPYLMSLLATTPHEVPFHPDSGYDQRLFWYTIGRDGTVINTHDDEGDSVSIPLSMPEVRRLHAQLMRQVMEEQTSPYLKRQRAQTADADTFMREGHLITVQRAKGKFARKGSAVSEALQKAGGAADALAGFDRPALMREAKARGLTVPRGAPADEVRGLIIASNTPQAPDSPEARRAALNKRLVSSLKDEAIAAGHPVTSKTRKPELIEMIMSGRRGGDDTGAARSLEQMLDNPEPGDREIMRERLGKMKLAELEDFANGQGETLDRRGNKPQKVQRLVETLIGRRLDSAAIARAISDDNEQRRRRDAEGQARAQREAEAPAVAAMQRQQEIDAVRPMSGFLADLEEGLGNDASIADLRRLADQSLRTRNVADDPVAQHVASTIATSIDKGDIRRAMNTAAAAKGLRLVDAGDGFDPATHEAIGNLRAGDPVELVRPGHSIQVGNETVVVTKPVVQLTETGDLRQELANVHARRDRAAAIQMNSLDQESPQARKAYRDMRDAESRISQLNTELGIPNWRPSAETATAAERDRSQRRRAGRRGGFIDPAASPLQAMTGQQLAEAIQNTSSEAVIRGALEGRDHADLVQLARDIPGVQMPARQTRSALIAAIARRDRPSVAPAGNPRPATGARQLPQAQHQAMAAIAEQVADRARKRLAGESSGFEPVLADKELGLERATVTALERAGYISRTANMRGDSVHLTDKGREYVASHGDRASFDTAQSLVTEQADRAAEYRADADRSTGESRRLSGVLERDAQARQTRAALERDANLGITADEISAAVGRSVTNRMQIQAGDDRIREALNRYESDGDEVSRRMADRLQKNNARGLLTLDEVEQQLADIEADRVPPLPAAPAGIPPTRRMNAGSVSRGDRLLLGDEVVTVRGHQRIEQDGQPMQQLTVEGPGGVRDIVVGVNTPMNRLPGGVGGSGTFAIDVDLLPFADPVPDDFAVSQMPEQLAEYWVHGAGAAKVRWNVRGAFRRARRLLRQEGVPEHMLDGAVANLYRRATGKHPGRHRDGSRAQVAGAAAMECAAEQADGVSPFVGWRGPLAPIDVATGDRRRFQPGALRSRPLPLPLRWQKHAQKGHEGAVTVGALTAYDLTPEGQIINSSGYFLDPRKIPEVIEAMHLVEHQVVGTSVDLAPGMKVAYSSPTTGMFEPAVCSVDGSCPTDAEVLVTDGEIVGATLVPIAAFAETRAPELFMRTLADDNAVIRSVFSAQTAAVTSHWDSLAIAPADTTWAGDAAARASLEAWARAEDLPPGEAETDWQIYRLGFLHVRDDRGGDEAAHYSLPIADVIDGELTIVPQAVFSAAMRLDSLPVTSREREALRGRISDLYDQMAETLGDDTLQPPWELSADGGCGCAEKWAKAAQTAALEGLSDGTYGVFGEMAPYDANLFRGKLDGPTPMTITDDGRVYGHPFQWSTCNRGHRGVCLRAPRSSTGYKEFHLGAARTTEGVLPVGKIVMGEGHADINHGVKVTRAFYDATSKTVAIGRVTEDEWGGAFFGVLAPGVTPQEATMFLASPPSGDWRNRELVGILAVNVPGHIVPRAELAAGSSEPVNIVAAGRWGGDDDITTDPLFDEAVRMFGGDDEFAAAQVAFTQLTMANMLGETR